MEHNSESNKVEEERGGASTDQSWGGKAEEEGDEEQSRASSRGKRRGDIPVNRAEDGCGRSRAEQSRADGKSCGWERSRTGQIHTEPRTTTASHRRGRPLACAGAGARFQVPRHPILPFPPSLSFPRRLDWDSEGFDRDSGGFGGRSNHRAAPFPHTRISCDADSFLSLSLSLSRLFLPRLLYQPSFHRHCALSVHLSACISNTPYNYPSLVKSYYFAPQSMLLSLFLVATLI